MKRKTKGALGIALLLPIIIIMAVLVYYPIIKTFSYSMQKMKLTAPQDTGFVGWANYQAVLKSDSFWYSLQNTLFLLVVVVLITTVFGICVALMLNVDTKISGVLMAAAVLPWALPPVFMNKLLIGIGVIDSPIEWMSRRFLLLFVVALVVAWRSIPFTAIVCLAGLRAIPHDLYEAARIDGAGRWSAFRHITGPLMVPFVGIGITSASITAINIFDEIVALAGYSDLGKNLLIESYLTTFSFLDFGKGSALTYIIMLISAVLGFFYLKNLTREVEY